MNAATWWTQLKTTMRRTWTLSSGDPELARLLGSRAVSSGVSVNEDTALNYSAVWQATQLIAGTIASLPLLFYRRRRDGGRDVYREHPLYRLLHDQWSPEHTSMSARETMQQHALLWGNGYAEIVRDSAGRPAELWVLTPDRVRPTRRSSDQALVYEVLQPTSRGTQVLLPSEILHIPGLSWDGIQGYGVVRRARETIGLGLATEMYGAKFFGQGAMAGGILESPQVLSPAATQKLRDSWAAAHEGVSRAHRIAVLESGITWKQASIAPEDAQFLETRKFQTVEIARWFNLPPHMLRDLERATFSNIEHQTIEFVVYTIRPWLVRWEAELKRKLVPVLEWNQQYPEHVLDGLLRGDVQSRTLALQTQFQNGALNLDEWRSLENRNPLPDGQGQRFYTSIQVVPIDQMGEKVRAATELVRAGYEPAAALAAIGLPPIPHLGLAPVTVQPEEPPEPEPLEPSPEEQDAAEEEADEVAKRALPPAPPMAAFPPPVDLAPLVTRLEAQDVEQAQLKARLAAMIPSLRALLEQTVRREFVFEGDRARKAAVTPEKCRAWIEHFYATRPATALAHLLPTMRLYGHLAQRPDIEAETRSRIEAEAAQSRAELLALLDANGGDLADEVAQIVARWERDRPSAVADALLQEILSHV
jgi:HK97 family phage portal protein